MVSRWQHVGFLMTQDFNPIPPAPKADILPPVPSGRYNDESLEY